MKLHEFYILIIIILYTPKRTLNCKKDRFHRHAYYITLMFSALFTSKRYYTRLSVRVISFSLHGFITLLHRVLCDNVGYLPGHSITDPS